MSFFAIRIADKPHWSNVYPCIQANPWGAGSCVRAKVADAYRRMSANSSILISGRKGGSLFSSEDIEIAWVACDIGLAMGVFPELSLTHLISKERVSREYILKIIEGWKASEILLAYKWNGDLPNSPLRPRGLLSILKNLIVQKGMHRHTYLAHTRHNSRQKHYCGFSYKIVISSSDPEPFVAALTACPAASPMRCCITPIVAASTPASSSRS